MLNEKIDQELSDDELKDASGGLKTVGENTQLNNNIDSGYSMPHCRTDDIGDFFLTKD